MPKNAKTTGAAKPKSKKVASKGKATKTNARGTRYTPKQKAEILDFVNQVNEEKGRGGAAAAARKFGISQITIGIWVKKAGKPSVSKKSSAKGRGRPKAVGNDVASKLRRLADLHEEISAAEAGLKSLKAEYVALKKGV